MNEEIVQNYLRDLRDGDLTPEFLQKAAEHGDENAEEALLRWEVEK